MKNLKEHINEAWAGVKKQTYNQDVIAWCEEMGIKNYTVNSKGEIDVLVDVDLTNKDFKELPFKFGTVDGYFTVGYNKKLTSLKNCPDKVTAYFMCSGCTNLTSLEGASEVVGGGFYCRYCTSLTSLVGVSKEIGGTFSCSYCSSLKSLDGGPKKVGGDFWCKSCKVKFTKEDVKKICKVKNKISV